MKATDAIVSSARKPEDTLTLLYPRATWYGAFILPSCPIPGTNVFARGTYVSIVNHVDKSTVRVQQQVSPLLRRETGWRAEMYRHGSATCTGVACWTRRGISFFLRSRLPLCQLLRLDLRVSP